MSMLFEDRSRARSFGEVARAFDHARPSYPPALFDDLLVDDPRTVLDVGCGTGIAASLLAARGCEVLGVEVDERMASVAHAKGISVEVAAFESWDDRGRRFDLLGCGQAWHWIDPRGGALKAAEVLSPGGRIGCFWNFGDPPAEVREALKPVYRRLAPELETDSVVLGNMTSRFEVAARELTASGGFEDVDLRRFPWSKTYGTAEWIAVVATHSDHLALPGPQLDALLAAVGSAIDSLGGSFEMAYRTMLVTARRC
jgi:SAM-dependent methyltransferase